jgi:hypothetical protein
MAAGKREVVYVISMSTMNDGSQQGNVSQQDVPMESSIE